MSISLIYIILYHTNLCELKSYCVENRVVLHCKKTYGTIKYQNSWQLILSFLPPLRKTDEHAWVECKWTLGRLLSLLELSILAVGSIVRPPSLALAIRVRNRAGDPMSLTLWVPLPRLWREKDVGYDQRLVLNGVANIRDVSLRGNHDSLSSIFANVWQRCCCCCILDAFNSEHRVEVRDSAAIPWPRFSRSIRWWNREVALTPFRITQSFSLSPCTSFSRLTAKSAAIILNCDEL